MISRPCLRPVIPLLAGFAAGILAGDLHPGIRAAAWAIAAFCFGRILFQLRRHKPAQLAPAALFAALGYLSIQPWQAPLLPAHHVIHHADRFNGAVAGQVLQMPEPGKDHIRFQMAARALGPGRTPVCGTLRVSLWGGGALPRPGDLIQVRGRIRKVHGFRNFGGFDYPRYLAFKGVRATLSGKADSLVIIHRRSPTGGRHILPRFRARTGELIAGIDSRHAEAVLNALILGDRSSLSPPLWEEFRQAGIAHLLAISGLHIGLIGLVGFGIARSLLSHIPFLLWQGWVTRAAALIALIPVLAYGVISGMSPSTQRAVGMAVILLAGLWLKRRTDTPSVLALVALSLLVLSPPLLFSISFQMSFAAVASIIAGHFALFGHRASAEESDPAARPPSRTGRIRARLVRFMAATLCAILGSLPLSLYYFNEFSLTGILANLVYIPLVGFGVVPLGLTAAFLNPILPVAASGVIHLCGLLLHFALAILPFFAALPTGGIKTVTPTLFEIGLYYCTLAMLFWWVAQRRKAQSERPGGGDARLRAAVLSTCLLVCWTGDTAYWVARRMRHTDLRVTIFDVGQGSAALIEFPGGGCTLVDGGGFYDNAIFDVGRLVVAPALWRSRIRTLDAVILSHPDADHLNGLLFVTSHFRIRRFISTGIPKKSAGYRTLVETLERRGIPAPRFSHLPRIMRSGPVTLEILYPPEALLASLGWEVWLGEENNLSIVLRLTMGNAGILLPGDIEAPAEAYLAGAHPDRLASTVLVAPHHGSRTSSTETLLEHINPRIVIISAGHQSRFRCPHPTVLERYADRSCRVYRTDRDGAIRLTTRGAEWEIRTGAGVNAPRPSSPPTPD